MNERNERVCSLRVLPVTELIICMKTSQCLQTLTHSSLISITAWDAYSDCLEPATGNGLPYLLTTVKLLEDIALLCLFFIKLFLRLICD